MVVIAPATSDRPVTWRMVTQDRRIDNQIPVHRNRTQHNDGCSLLDPNDYTVFIPAISPFPPLSRVTLPAAALSGYERGAYLRSRRCSELR